MAHYRHRRMRELRSYASAPALPPLLRLWAGQVTGVPARFAPHEVHRIKTKPATPLSDWRNGFSGPGTEWQYQAARSSQTENSQTRILPEEEIIRWLQRCMLKHCLDRSLRIPIAVIARMADVSSKLLYLIVLGRRRLTETVRIRLSAVLSGLDDGTISCCGRVGQEWQIDYREPPDPLPPPQEKCVRAEDWNEWARCRTCGGHRYTLVTMGNRLWYLCDHCRPWRTDGTGAQLVEARRRRREPT
jgi:hypothetical protein